MKSSKGELVYCHPTDVERRKSSSCFICVQLVRAQCRKQRFLRCALLTERLEEAKLSQED